MAKEKVLKCVYAGDPEDEYCSTCNGVTITDEETGEEGIPATECGGYEKPEEIKPAKPAKPAKPTKPTTTPATKPSAPAAEPRETKETPPSNTNTPATSEDTENSLIENKDASEITYSFKVKEISAESGITFDIKNANGTSTWYKLSYGEVRTIAEDITEEELFDAKKHLWDTVNEEVDHQVAEIHEMLSK